MWRHPCSQRFVLDLTSFMSVDPMILLRFDHVCWSSVELEVFWLIHGISEVITFTRFAVKSEGFEHHPETDVQKLAEPCGSREEHTNLDGVTNWNVTKNATEYGAVNGSCALQALRTHRHRNSMTKFVQHHLLERSRSADGTRFGEESPWNDRAVHDLVDRLKDSLGGQEDGRVNV